MLGYNHWSILVNTGQYWSLDSSSPGHWILVKGNPDSSPYTSPRVWLRQAQLRRRPKKCTCPLDVCKKHPRGRHSPARSVSSRKVCSEIMIFTNCLHNFLTLGNAGSTEISGSAKPGRRFPHIWQHNIDKNKCF